MAKPRKLVIGAPRAGDKDESEVRWLISYSDFMMQLVCLFILLYSVSSLDKGRMTRVASSYRAAIGIGELAAHEERSTGERLAIGDRSFLAGDLGGSDLPRDLRVRLTPVTGGLRAAFEAPVFDAGSSELSATGAAAIDDAARTLRAYAGRALVTASGDDAADGDALPLALSRAQAVVRRLVAAGLDPRFVAAAGKPSAEPRRVTIELRTD